MLFSLAFDIQLKCSEQTCYFLSFLVRRLIIFVILTINPNIGTITFVKTALIFFLEKKNCWIFTSKKMHQHIPETLIIDVIDTSDFLNSLVQK
jgi:hypothetical protein